MSSDQQIIRLSTQISTLEWKWRNLRHFKGFKVILFLGRSASHYVAIVAVLPWRWPYASQYRALQSC